MTWMPAGPILALLVSLSAAAHNRDCEMAVLRVPEDRAERFLTETISADLNAFGDYWAEKHAPFRQWLTENGIKWNALQDGGKYHTLARYFVPKLSIYSRQNIEQRRRTQLAAELAHRGAPGRKHPDGYVTLRRLSAANLARLLARFEQTMPGARRLPLGHPQLGVIAQAVEDLRIAYIHNTNGLNQRPAFPLLSARELMGMGITEKLNTHPFNSEALRTHGNVYFFAIPYARRGPFPEVRRAYGNTSIILSGEFADEWGVLSPYVMRPEDLEELANAVFPDEMNEVRLTGQREWAPVVRRLHTLDLRPADFMTLIRETLRLSLEHLAVTDPSVFQQVLESVRTGNGLFDVIDRYSVGRLGISFANGYRSLELKIPVAVPTSVLDVRMVYDPTGFGEPIGPGPKAPHLNRFLPEPPF